LKWCGQNDESTKPFVIDLDEEGRCPLEVVEVADANDAHV